MFGLSRIRKGQILFLHKLGIYRQTFFVTPFYGADNGTRTRNTTLEESDVTVTLYPHILLSGRISPNCTLMQC